MYAVVPCPAFHRLEAGRGLPAESTLCRAACLDDDAVLRPIGTSAFRWGITAAIGYNAMTVLLRRSLMPELAFRVLLLEIRFSPSAKTSLAPALAVSVRASSESRGVLGGVAMSYAGLFSCSITRSSRR